MDIYKSKYIKYKKKYLKLKQLAGSSNEEINYFDPQIFINILTENNITIKDQSQFKHLAGEGSKHTAFSEVIELINKSVNKLINSYKNTNPAVLLIPMFTEQAGSSLTKSNFWFSLLYLKRFTELNFPIKDVVLINRVNNNSKYFEKLKSTNEKINVIICDDGIYSGNQMIQTLRSIIENKCFINHINQIYICVPFCIAIEKFTVLESQKYIETKKHLVEFISKKEEELMKKNRINKRTKYVGTAKERIDNYISQLNKKINEFISKQGNIYEKVYQNSSGNFELQYYIDKFTMCIGDSNFNKQKNHWFDHKIPDGYSFEPPYRGSLKNQFLPPYKIEWKVNGDVITPPRNSKLGTSVNPNEVLFNQSLDINKKDSVSSLKCKN